MIEIGNVEIPIVSGINIAPDALVDEIEPTNTDTVAVKHEKEPLLLVISGFLNEEVHSSSKTIEEQKNEIRSLKDNSVIENTINFNEWKGHLLIEDIDFTDNSDSRIINEVEIDARYHPWPKFYPENEP
jgi:hypothetical protein